MGDFQQVLQTVIPSPPVVHTTAPPSHDVITAPVVDSTAPPSNVPSIPAFTTPSKLPIILPARATASEPILATTTTNVAPTGNILPNVTFQSQGVPYYIPLSYLSSLVISDPLKVSTLNALTINTSTLNASTINVTSTFSQNILTSYIEATESYVYDKLTLDNQELTANATELLLNGNPIVTANNISSIADWSKDPAISTVRMNNNDLTGGRYASFSTINANSMVVNNLTTLFSTTIETYESTIQSDIKLANISSFYATYGSISSLTASTLTAGNYVVASETVNDLTVNHNFTVNNGTGGTTTFNQAPTFTSGATFNTTAPTFNAGLNTASLNVTGATNFNGNNLNNVGTISADNVTTQAKYTNTVNANVGSAIGDYASPATVNIKGVGGSGGVVNITGDSATVLNPGNTYSQVNIEAKGNSGVAFLAPRGGKVSIIADAGATTLTPTTGTLGNGAIELTAYSFINGAFSVPGVIKQSAGSCSMYAGAVTPVTGILGYNYIYATLGNVIVAGTPPSLPAFPTTNYLYGTAGTSINNGLYTDNIFSYGTSNLNITAQPGYWVDIRRTQYLGMGNSPVIDGGSVNGVIQNFSNVSASEHNGTNFTATGQVKAPLLSTMAMNVSSINNAVYPPPASGWIGTATSALNMNGFPLSNATQVSTMNVNLSSINGAVYPPASGGSWVSTATTDLNMSGLNINNVSTINFASPGGGGGTGYIAQMYGTSGSLLISDTVGIAHNAPTNILQTPTGNTIWSIKDTGAIINQPGKTTLNGQLNVSSFTTSSSYLGNTKSYNWSQTGSTTGNWSAVTGGAVSGVYYACVNGGFIYYTTNGGTTWTRQGTTQAWTGIAIVGTPGRAIACVAGGGIYYTTNSGTTWTLAASAPTANWSAVASYPFSGNYSLACIDGGQVYYSTNGGSSWLPIPGSVTANWKAISITSTVGMYVVNTNLTCPIYYADAGFSSLSAASSYPPQTGNYNSIYICNVGGNYKMLVGQSTGFIYVSDLRNTYNNFAWTLSTTAKGYVGGQYNGATMVCALPNSPIQVSYDYGTTWFVSNSLSLPWSCIIQQNADVSINPCLAGTTSGGYVWSDIPNSTLPTTNIIGHNTNIISDTGNVTFTPQQMMISSFGATSIEAPYVVNITVGNGYLNLNAYTRFLQTTNAYLPQAVYYYNGNTGADLRQPLTQYGTATGSGTSGTVAVTIPSAYASSSSYVVQVTMRDAPTAQLYATPTANNAFTIGWSSAGAGTQNIMWVTFGT